MSRTTQFALSIALAASFALTPRAGAWPLGRIFHLHPARGMANEVSFKLLNRSAIVQNLEIGERRVSLTPNSRIAVTAPAGANVIATTTAPGQKPDSVLFVVQSSLQHNTVVIR